MNPIVLNKLRIPLIALFVSVSSASAIITDFTFFDGMNGSNETTSNASLGYGSINILQHDSTAGAFGTLTVDISFFDLTGNASAAHIHGYAPVGANAGALYSLSLFLGLHPVV